MSASENALADSATVGKAAWEELRRRNGSLSVDELLVLPSMALEVCRVVRKKLQRKLRDDQILRSLLNARKRGLLK